VNAGNGLLVPPDDVPALAAGLRQMFERAAGFDLASLRADALARFSRAAVAAQLAAVYERVLTRR